MQNAIVSDSIWDDLREFSWTKPGSILVKTPITPVQVPNFKSAHISAGGNVAFSSFASAAEIPSAFSGLTLRGDAPLWIGGRKKFSIEDGVKHALDPQNRFPSLDD